MPSLTIKQAFDLALQHHQSGHLLEAEQIYRNILAHQPDHPDAIYLLGMVALQLGQHEVAVDFLRRAVVLRPNWPEALCNLGDALSARGQFVDAISAYRQAIALSPNMPEVHNNLGNAFAAEGRLNEAIVAYRQAIGLNPNLAESQKNLAVALSEVGELDEAIVALRRVIVLKPDNAEAHNLLGNILQTRGQLDEAISAHCHAITLKPDYAEAQYNLGNDLAQRGQPDEAILAYQTAISLKHNYVEAYGNLGNALQAMWRPDEAIAACHKALALNPNLPEVHNNLGNSLRDKGQLDEALAAYRQALALRPDFARAHSNLIFLLLYHPSYDGNAIADECRRWNLQYAHPLRNFVKPHANDRNPDRCLRIGYVSSDFREHAVGRNILPLFSNQDRRQFEIYCYSHAVRQDAMNHRFQQLADGWREIGSISDDLVVQQIRNDRIDILVDLGLHTAHNRLLIFARKPAPVQVTFAGYPGSTGLDAIDYRLSDPRLDPAGIDESIYSETTVRLPHSFWCYDPHEGRDIPVNSLPAEKNGFITFGCLNNFCKINDGVLSLWAKILQQVANSRILLLAHPGTHRQRTIDRFSADGIETARVEFVSYGPFRNYLELYHRIDIGLDTFPYNGHTTSLDSFWMGVPVVTLSGEKTVSRAGASLLANLGLSELTATTSTDFIRIATSLASDIPSLAQRRFALRGIMQHSPLMNAPQFARDIESAYRVMWRTWCHNPDRTGKAS